MGNSARIEKGLFPNDTVYFNNLYLSPVGIRAVSAIYRFSYIPVWTNSKCKDLGKHAGYANASKIAEVRGIT